MTAKDILIEWLKNNGYDGLTNDIDCGCLIDDLCPCEDAWIGCKPGYKGIKSVKEQWAIWEQKGNKQT